MKDHLSDLLMTIFGALVFAGSIAMSLVYLAAKGF